VAVAAPPLPIFGGLDLFQMKMMDPLNNHETCPDIIEFVTGQAWLNRPQLYPRQATFLKVLFLEVDLLTDYDYEVIEEWNKGFVLPAEAVRSLDIEGDAVMRYVGDWGIQPDILRRMSMLRERNYPWFSVVLNVLGRRSGKGHVGALAFSYVLWKYINMVDPREWFGIDPSKRLAAQIFAGKKMQARDNQWRDIVNVITGAPCFEKYISQSLAESLTIYSPKDLEQLPGRRVDTTMDLATFEIVPKEATTMAARGPASFAQGYDEMAHMTATTGGSRSAGEVWDSATPSLDQFKKWSFIYCGSSPWAMNGKFYELCTQALQVDADTHEPIYPEYLMLQLESWDMYKDWELTRDGTFLLRPECERRVPGGTRPYPEIYATPLKLAIQEYDERMRRLERANPDTFRVERRAKWATAMDAYFPEQHVRRMFAPWPAEHRLPMKRSGDPTITYVMHGDPGKTGSNFGFAVAHKEYVEGSPIPHVVFDYIHGWMPGDFPNEYSEPGHPENEMDYTAIEAEIKVLMDGFQPMDVSLDPWNSIGMLQRLSRHARDTSYKTVNVWERTVTASVNWKTAETMKTALALNLVHCPVYDLLELECLFLRKLPGDKVDHPDSGPVTTKDVYDAVSICIHKLIGNDVALYMGEELAKLSPAVGMPGLNNPDSDPHNPLNQFSNLRTERMNQRRRAGNTPPPRAPRRTR
jgi:hypothetical protein